MNEFPERRGLDHRRLTMAENFLQPTIPTGNANYYNQTIQTMAKEFSVGNFQREDVPSYVKGSDCARIFLIRGQSVRAHLIMNSMITEAKTSMSIDAGFAHLLFKDTLEYTQTQNMHEYVHQPIKKGFLGLGSSGGE